MAYPATRRALSTAYIFAWVSSGTTFPRCTFLIFALVSALCTLLAWGPRHLFPRRQGCGLAQLRRAKRVFQGVRHDMRPGPALPTPSWPLLSHCTFCRAAQHAASRAFQAYARDDGNGRVAPVWSTPTHRTHEKFKHT